MGGRLLWPKYDHLQKPAAVTFNFVPNGYRKQETLDVQELNFAIAGSIYHYVFTITFHKASTWKHKKHKAIGMYHSFRPTK